MRYPGSAWAVTSMVSVRDVGAFSTRYRYLTQWQRHPQTTAPSPLDTASQQEQHHLVRSALEQLTPPQRQVLELSYYQGKSQGEIAEQLGVLLGTVKSWARRGLLALRSHLQTQLKKDPP